VNLRSIRTQFFGLWIITGLHFVCVCVCMCVCVCVCARARARARMFMFTYMYILSCDYSFPACKNCDLHQTYQNVTTYLISQKGLETKEIFRYHFTFFRLQASKYRVSSLCDLYNVVVISSCCIAWNFTIIGEKGIGRVAEGRRCGHERWRVLLLDPKHCMKVLKF